VSSSFDSKANNCIEDTAMGFRASDPTEMDKSVVPSDTTDQRSNDKLECNTSRVAASKPKKNRKSKCGPNKIHASKHAIKRSKMGALVDRGVNGGMLRNNAKVIFKRNKTADVTGVDNHELNALPMVDATAKAVADNGPVILVLRNCACHGLNRTPHSAGQIELHLNKAHNTSMKVGGRQVIKTVDGCCIPINIIRGLPCMQMEPNTAKEFDTLPHAMLTQGGEWDPAALDHMLTDDPDWVSKAKHKEDQEHDSPFDNRGECKHREPVRAGVAIDNPTGPPSEDPDDIEVNLHNGEIEVNFHADNATREAHQALHAKTFRTSTRHLFTRAKACLMMKLRRLKTKRTRPKKTLKQTLLQQRPSRNLLITPSVGDISYMCQSRRSKGHLLLRLRMQLQLHVGPRRTKLLNLQIQHSTSVEERKQQQQTLSLLMYQRLTHLDTPVHRCSLDEAHCSQTVMDSVLQVNFLTI